MGEVFSDSLTSQGQDIPALSTWGWLVLHLFCLPLCDYSSATRQHVVALAHWTKALTPCTYQCHLTTISVLPVPPNHVTLPPHEYCGACILRSDTLTQWKCMQPCLKFWLWVWWWTCSSPMQSLTQLKGDGLILKGMTEISRAFMMKLLHCQVRTVNQLTTHGSGPPLLG